MYAPEPPFNELSQAAKTRMWQITAPLDLASTQ